MVIKIKTNNKSTTVTGWKTTNQWEYTLSCLFFFFLAAFYEWLSTYRNNLRRSVKSDYTSIQDDSIQPYSTPYPFILTDQSRRSMLRGHHFRLTLLYTFQLAISYIIMLVVMTFNGGLFVSCILGFGVGYFLFGASRALEAAPSCHVSD